MAQNEVLINFKLYESTSDSYLFYRLTNTDRLIVVLYVDDGLVAAAEKSDIDEFLYKLKMEFKIIIQPVGYFLNVPIKLLDDGSVFSNQKTYAESVIRRFDMSEANSVMTPIEKHLPIREVKDYTFTTIQYREALGCLKHSAVVSRPVIAFAMNYVS